MVHFWPFFFFGVPLLKATSRNQGTLSIKGLLGFRVLGFRV